VGRVGPQMPRRAGRVGRPISKNKKEIKNPVGLHDALGRKMFWAV
jgi:hypothetical protein